MIAQHFLRRSQHAHGRNHTTVLDAQVLHGTTRDGARVHIRQSTFGLIRTIRRKLFQIVLQCDNGLVMPAEKAQRLATCVPGERARGVCILPLTGVAHCVANPGSNALTSGGARSREQRDPTTVDRHRAAREYYSRRVTICAHGGGGVSPSIPRSEQTIRRVALIFALAIAHPLHAQQDFSKANVTVVRVASSLRSLAVGTNDDPAMTTGR